MLKKFVTRFNKTLFDYIRDKVQKVKELDGWDDGNIWYQLNKEFVHWFDMNTQKTYKTEPILCFHKGN